MYIEHYMGAFENFAERDALTCLSTNKTFAYGDLDKLSNRLGHRFRDDGLEKGDVVMVCLFNTFHLPAVMLGSWKNLQIFSPINFRLAPGEIGKHFEDSQPKILFYDSDLNEVIREALRLSGHRPGLLVSTAKSQVEGAIGFDDYIKDSSENDPGLEDRIRLLDPLNHEIERLFTSGTTGLPKGVKFTGSALLNIAFKTMYNNRYTSKDKLMNLTPWFHQGGLCTAVQPGLLVGGHIFGLKQFDPELALDYVEAHGITFVAGAPATLNAMAASQEKKRRDLSSLRLVHSNGAPASRREFLMWKKIFTEHVVNSYGTTETASTLCLRSDIHPIEEKAGSAGRPFISVQARVIQFDTEEGKANPDDLIEKDGDELGQIICRSLGMLHGYHNRPEEEEKKLYKGWFYTGDAASWDEDGFITVRGRTDDMFVSGGENIFPHPVEEVLEKHPKVRECVVVGMPDEKWGRVAVAFVVPGEAAPTIEELDKHCIEDPDLARYKRPRYYQLVETLPYTPTGKKLRYKMAERLHREKLTPIPSQT